MEDSIEANILFLGIVNLGIEELCRCIKFDDDVEWIDNFLRTGLTKDAIFSENEFPVEKEREMHLSAGRSLEFSIFSAIAGKV